MMSEEDLDEIVQITVEDFAQTDQTGKLWVLRPQLGLPYVLLFINVIFYNIDVMFISVSYCDNMTLIT